MQAFAFTSAPRRQSVRRTKRSSKPGVQVLALSGRLRLCAATTFASLMILPRLPEFLATHPDLEVDIILDDRMIDLVSEGVDIALRIGDLADSSAVARRIATGRRSVVASPAYLDRHGVPRTPSELVPHQAIVHPQLGNSWTFAKAGTELTVQLSGRVRFTAAEGIRAAVKAGMGLAVASEWMFWPELQRGEVVRLLDDWHLPEIDLWAVYPTGRLATAKARAFADFAETVMR